MGSSAHALAKLLSLRFLKNIVKSCLPIWDDFYFIKNSFVLYECHSLGKSAGRYRLWKQDYVLKVLLQIEKKQLLLTGKMHTMMFIKHNETGFQIRKLCPGNLFSLNICLELNKMTNAQKCGRAEVLSDNSCDFLPFCLTRATQHKAESQLVPPSISIKGCKISICNWPQEAFHSDLTMLLGPRLVWGDIWVLPILLS